MRELLLMRHAEAVAHHPGLADHDRPLTAHGREAARKAAHRLQRAHGVPELVLYSPAVRTRETAAHLGAALALPSGALRSDPRIYQASPDGLLELLRELPAAVRRVLLVGHNPAVSQLAHALDPAGSRRSFATAEFRLLRLPVTDWFAIGDLP